MTTPAASAGSNLSLSSVNTELTYSSTAAITMNDSPVRRLGDKTTAGAQIGGTDLGSKTVAPTIVGSNTANAAAGSGSTVTVNLPSGIVAGNLIIIWIGTGDNISTGPSGYTEITSAAATPAVAVYAKVATGGESSTSFTKAADTVESVWVTARVGTWWATSAGWNGARAAQLSATPDPPSLTTGFGSVPTLFFASMGIQALRNVTGTPTGYTVVQQGSLSNTKVYVYYKIATAATDDPSAFTLGLSAGWVATTTGIRGCV